MKALWPFFAGLFALLTACQSAPESEEEPHVVAEYFVRYLQEERQLKAQASFYLGDSLSEATPRSIPGGISFQGTPMERRNLGRHTIRYSFTHTADYASQFRFSYKDEQGRFREHILSMKPVTDFFIDGPASRSLGIRLRVEGGQLRAAESLLFLFSDAQNRAYSIELEGPREGQEYFLPPEQLSELPVGPGQLYLVKKRGHVVEGERQTTISAVEYYSVVLGVEIVP